MELENIIYPGFNKTLSELNALSKVKKKSCEIVDLTEIEWVRDVLRHRVEEIGSYDIKFRKPTKEEIQTVSKIVGADINELSPIKGFDSYNFLVAKLAYKILSYKFLYK